MTADKPTEAPKPTVQVDGEHHRPRLTRVRLEAPPTAKTTTNIVHRALHDLDEGAY